MYRLIIDTSPPQKKNMIRKKVKKNELTQPSSLQTRAALRSLRVGPALLEAHSVHVRRPSCTAAAAPPGPRGSSAPWPAKAKSNRHGIGHKVDFLGNSISPNPYGRRCPIQKRRGLFITSLHALGNGLRSTSPNWSVMAPHTDETSRSGA